MVQIPPPVHGAALRNQSLLKSKLLNDSFNIISLPLQFADSMSDLEKFSFRKIRLMCTYVIKLVAILLTRKINLAYFTMSPGGGAFYRDILLITILKLFRKKRILHFRVKGIKNTSQKRVGRALVKYAFRGSEIVCLSKHHVSDLAEFIKTKPYLVPNGIKVESEYFYLLEKDRPSHALPKILFLSNLSKRKGVPELIAALKMLHLKNYKFSAQLVGSEWDMSFADVHTLIEQNGLSTAIAIEGGKYNAEKYQLLAEADIFVFPTYFELFPGVILEAMQFGKAIVSTFEGSIPEIIDNNINGKLVEQQNVQQLAEAIGFMIDNPQARIEMGSLARQKFFSAFTLESFEYNMLQVFNEVLAK